MTMITLIEFIILFGAILLGIRFGGLALGFGVALASSSFQLSLVLFRPRHPLT